MENKLQHRRPEPRKLPYQLLKRITDGFTDDQKLGNGAFGSVYKGVHENGEVIAVKVLRNVREFDHKQFRNEFENLALLDHQNVVRLVGYCNETEETLMDYEGKQVIAHEIRLALCMEYVDNGSLSKHISDEHHLELTWHICYKIIEGICEGLNYLHYGLVKPILHLDLKPDNILLDKNMVPKIADFGLSRLFGEETTSITASYVGTRGYLPPEYIQRQIISKEFDIYSLGVIITKIMVGSNGYYSIDDMPYEKFAAHVHNNWKGRLVEKLSPSLVEGLCQQVKTCIEIALKCLNPQKRERPSMQEIISELRNTETMIGDLAVQPKQFSDEEPMLSGQSNISERHSPDHQNLEHRPGNHDINDLPENNLKELITQDNDEKKRRAVINHNINIFTHDDIQKITKNYARLIGEGGFGQVYQEALDDGTLVVVKKYIYPFKEWSAEELIVHSHINHKNIVRFLGYFAEENALMMVTEFVNNGNLNNLLHGSDNPIGFGARLSIAIECAEALSYMHSSMYEPIIHGGIKPANILLDDNLSAKLSDFGISRILSMDITEQTMNVTGSRGYMDPELLLKGCIDPKNDVYSFGVVLIELLTRKKSLEHMESLNLIEKFMQSIQKGKSARQMFDAEITNVDIKILVKIGNLAVDCMKRDFKERPEMKDVVQCLRMIAHEYHQQGQEKTSQWSLWGILKLNRDSSSSNSKLGILDIFKRRVHRNSIRDRFPITITLFTKKELKQILKRKNLIGQGAFGEAYKGYLGADNRRVVVKNLINVDSLAKDQFANEILVQSQVIHKNIIKLIGCCLEVDAPVLVYEFASRGSLEDILHGSNKAPLNLDLRLQIATQSARGIAYLHSETTAKILHGDIRPANILLTDDYVVKISDFGISRLIGNDQEYVIGDMHCIDPEYMMTGRLTIKSDVYSFGVVLLELITRKKATLKNSLISNFLESYIEGVRVVELVDPEIAAIENMELLDGLAGLIKQCLDPDVDRRPTMTNVAEYLLILTKAHHQGQQKIDQWSQRNTQDRTATFRSYDTLRKISNAASRSSIRKGYPILEQCNITIYTKEELKPILKNRNLIGKGGFCEVYKGYLGADNQLVAVKKPINVGSAEKDRSEKEILVQSQVVHKNILKLIGCCLEVDVPILVYEFASRGSLEDILHNCNNNMPLNLDLRLQIAAQSARGIAYMHSETTAQILHGDIKPANILLTEDFVVKISGFRLSKLIDNDREYADQVIGDLNYMDPVYLQTGLITDKTDVYSFGVVLLELITRKKAAYHNKLIVHFLESFRECVRVAELVDPEIAAIENSEVLDDLGRMIRQCLNLDVDERPAMTYVAERLSEMLKRSRTD